MYRYAGRQGTFKVLRHDTRMDTYFVSIFDVYKVVPNILTSPILED